MPFHRLLLLAFFAAGAGLYAQSGFVKSANQPIPGATVTATIGDRKIVTTTDQSGRYAFPPQPAGDCSIDVRMFGFEPASKKSNCAEAAKVDFALQLQESPMAQRMARMGGAQGGGNQLESQLQNEISAPEAAAPGAAPVDGQNSSEAFQVSGSLSQGLAQNSQPDFGMMMGGPGRPRRSWWADSSGDQERSQAEPRVEVLRAAASAVRAEAALAGAEEVVSAVPAAIVDRARAGPARSSVTAGLPARSMAWRS